MNRLRQAGDSHYDVLGVSPRASADEIDSAFRQLIDGEGYKAGVPLNRQWLRARQIKDAHATLGDPAMRQAYDESLHQVPGPAPWALTAEDPATDELVVPGPRADEPPATGSTPEPGPEGLPGPEAQEQLADDDQPPADLEPTSNDNEIVFDPAVKDNQRSSVRAWGAAAAVAGVLGLLILTPWPGLDRQSSAG
ncbi:MAG TPA: hypothetical protein VFO12_06690, partial [Sphingomicrobium sp.]|nr:hypothetical protein [Sphingomicrobium sp.]